MSEPEQVASPHKYTTIQSLESFLKVIKSLPKEDLDYEYSELLRSAHSLLGQVNPLMAHFYFEYGDYLLRKIEKNGEVFGTYKPTKQQKKIVEANESEEESHSEDQLPENEKKNENHVCFEGDGVVIEQESGNSQDKQQINHEKSQKKASATKQGPESEQQQQNQEEEDDDEQVCHENLHASLQILMDQQTKYLDGQLTLTQQEWQKLLDDISRVKHRLGDLFNIKENFEQSLKEFSQAIEYRKRLNTKECDRMRVSLELAIGNTYQYEGKEGCEEKSLTHFIEVVKILVAQLQNITIHKEYPLPTLEKPIVERLHYLPKWDDNDQARQIKSILADILDKIEDTEAQRKEYEELRKIKEEQKKSTEEKENGFKPVPHNTPVINLGTFGNANTLIRRKTPNNIQAEIDGLNHQPLRENP